MKKIGIFILCFLMTGCATKGMNSQGPPDLSSHKTESDNLVDETLVKSSREIERTFNQILSVIDRPNPGDRSNSEAPKSGPLSKRITTTGAKQHLFLRKIGK